MCLQSEVIDEKKIKVEIPPTRPGELSYLIYMICELNMCIKTLTHKTHIHLYKHMSVFLISTIGPKSFLFGTVQFSLWASGAVNYDYIVTNSIKSLLIGSRRIPNGAHTNHC